MMPRFELMVAVGARVARKDAVPHVMQRPIALAPAGGRQVIGQVSAAAEAFAVKPGLPVGEAFARCPELKLLPPDPAAAERGWEHVLRALEGIGAEVESDPEKPGTLFFEADGLARLHRGLGGVIAAARDAIGRPVRIGVAGSRFVARAAARTARPRKPRIIGSDLERREFLANAPVAWLGMHSDACAELANTLQKLGIETLGEYAVLRRAQIAERFGRVGLTARDLVYGQEPPLRPRRPAEQLRERIELVDEADGQAARGDTTYELDRALTLLIERLVSRRERADRSFRTLSISARFAEGGSWSERMVFREPTADPVRIKLVAERRLEQLPEPAVSLELAVAVFGPPDHESETLFGDDSDAERKRRLKSAAEQARQAAGSPDKVARVVRLAEGSRLPERRAALSPGPVPLMQPRPVEVQLADDGRPAAVASRPVTEQRERWIVEDRWWTPRPVRRQYYELVLQGGVNRTLFEDLRTHQWFEQRA